MDRGGKGWIVERTGGMSDLAHTDRRPGDTGTHRTQELGAPGRKGEQEGGCQKVRKVTALYTCTAAQVQLHTGRKAVWKAGRKYGGEAGGQEELKTGSICIGQQEGRKEGSQGSRQVGRQPVKKAGRQKGRNSTR